MSLTRILVWALVLILPLTAMLVLAVDDVLVPHPSSKHAPSASRAALKVPSGVAAAMTALLAPPLLGALVVSAPPVVASVARRPPFVPPRG